MGILRKCFTNYHNFVREKIRDRRKYIVDADTKKELVGRSLETLPLDYDLRYRKDDYTVSHSTAFLEELAELFESVKECPLARNQQFNAVYRILVEGTDIEEIASEAQTEKEMAISLYNEGNFDLEDAEDIINQAEEFNVKGNFEDALRDYILKYQKRLESRYDEDLSFEQVFDLTFEYVVPFARMRYRVRREIGFLKY